MASQRSARRRPPRAGTASKKVQKPARNPSGKSKARKLTKASNVKKSSARKPVAKKLEKSKRPKKAVESKKITVKKTVRGVKTVARKKTGKEFLKKPAGETSRKVAPSTSARSSEAAPSKSLRMRSQPVEVQEIDVKHGRRRKSRLPSFFVRSYGKEPRRARAGEVLDTLNKYLGRPQAVAQRNYPKTLAEFGIFSIFEAGKTSMRAALEAASRLVHAFPDWNEFRVSDVFEFVEILEDLKISDLYDRCEQVQEFINEVYQDQNAVDLEFLRERTPEERLQTLNRYQALGPALAQYLALALQDFKGILFQYSWARVIQRLGLVPRAGSPKALMLSLERLYARDADLVAAQVNLIRLGEEICHSKKPHCKTCFLVLSCKSRKV